MDANRRHPDRVIGGQTSVIGSNPDRTTILCGNFFQNNDVIEMETNQPPLLDRQLIAIIDESPDYWVVRVIDYAPQIALSKRNPAHRQYIRRNLHRLFSDHRSVAQISDLTETVIQ